MNKQKRNPSGNLITKKINMIHILIGYSGSGKTSWTRNMMEKTENVVRVNRDDLRRTMFMLESDYYSHPEFREREKLISEVSEQIMYDALNKGRDIILDNTHLQLKYIDEIIRKFNHLSPISLEFIETSLGIAKSRVALRDGIKDVSYIDRQYYDFIKLKKQMHGRPLFYPQTSPQVSFDQNLPKAYIFDIDGNLALKGDRDIFDDSKLHLDSEIQPVGKVLRALDAAGYKIIFLSGRQDSCRKTTKKWLEDNGLWTEHSEMFMRKAKDQRCDSIVKEELLVKHVVPKYNVIGVFDDRLRVNRTWYKLGVFCFNTNQSLIQF